MRSTDLRVLSRSLGAAVEGRVDWQRRLDLMQQHTADHLFSALVHRRFGLENIGFHIGEELTHMDFGAEITPVEIDALELDGDKIKDTSALDELVKGTFSGLVTTTTVEGAKTATPPTNTGGGKMTKADIYKKDDHGRYVMSAAERQKALMENQIT